MFVFSLSYCHRYLLNRNESGLFAARVTCKCVSGKFHIEFIINVHENQVSSKIISTASCFGDVLLSFFSSWCLKINFSLLFNIGKKLTLIWLFVLIVSSFYVFLWALFQFLYQVYSPTTALLKKTSFILCVLVRYFSAIKHCIICPSMKRSSFLRRNKFCQCRPTVADGLLNEILLTAFLETRINCEWWFCLKLNLVQMLENLVDLVWWSFFADLVKVSAVWILSLGLLVHGFFRINERVFWLEFNHCKVIPMMPVQITLFVRSKKNFPTLFTKSKV